MRKIRICVVLFFIISCVCFAVYTVKVTIKADKTPPVITFEEDELSISLEDEEASLLQGVTAKDEESGDITDRVQVASLSKLSNGKRTAKYVVFDDANQVAIAERTIVYTDYVPPRIHADSPLRFSMEYMKNEENSLPVKAVDVIDGDISDKIRISFEYMSTMEPGNFPVTFQVNNSAGDTCVVNLEITIVDTSAGEAGKYYPELSEYILYTQVGKELQLSSYLTGVASQSERYVFGAAGTPANISADRVTIESTVDYTTPGVYKVNYSYTTRSNVKATTTAFVVVEG